MATQNPNDTTTSDPKALDLQSQTSTSIPIDPSKVRPEFDEKITQMTEKMASGLDYLATR